MAHPTDQNSEDVGSDQHDDSGTYVGETEPDDAIDAGETGAEARSERGGQ